MDIKFDADAALSKLGEALNTYGPKAMEVACQLKQADSIITLAWGGVGLVCLIASAVVFFLALRSKEDSDSWAITAMLTGLVSLVVTLINLGDAWAWIGAFNPRLAIAHDIFLKVTQIAS